MASLRKRIKRFKKEERLIVKLALRKGLINKDKANELAWQEFTQACKSRTPRKLTNGNNYRPKLYYPELMYTTFDYWGEGSEHSVVGDINYHYFLIQNPIDEETGHFHTPEGKFNKVTRIGLIKWLRSLPDRRNPKSLYYKPPVLSKSGLDKNYVNYLVEKCVEPIFN
jgi:hypothetical protein